MILFLIFSHVSLSFNLESEISRILDLILVFSLFAFGSSTKFLLFDFSANLDPNQVIFDYVDSSMSSLSKIIKIPYFSLCHFV